MASMKWFLHSACHLIGYNPNNKDTNMCPKHNIQDDSYDVFEGTKMSKNTMPKIEVNKEMYPSGFQMPLHYPRYKKSDYEKMEEWRLDLLLMDYGLCFKGTLDEKREYAMGAFLWPGEY